VTSGGSAPTLVVLAAGQAKRYGGVKPLAPVGPSGEAVIDVLASDAVAAGFGRIVLVIGPATGPAIRYHVERTWPGDVDVGFAVQAAPRGTVDAVLAAMCHVPATGSFGIANADDVYGEDGLRLLARHVGGGDGANALVCYRLRHSLIGDTPVTRGICDVGSDGLLRGVDERRQVTPTGDGRIFSHDGRTPAELDPDALASMNLWGFRSDMAAVLEDASRTASDVGEVLLPDVVDDLVTGRHSGAGRTPQFRVLVAPGRCIGVTHMEDLPLVQAELASQVGRGERAGQLWSERWSERWAENAGAAG
jgi:MobA-like NTP transferase domain